MGGQACSSTTAKVGLNLTEKEQRSATVDWLQQLNQCVSCTCLRGWWVYFLTCGIVQAGCAGTLVETSVAADLPL